MLINAILLVIILDEVILLVGSHFRKPWLGPSCHHFAIISAISPLLWRVHLIGFKFSLACAIQLTEKKTFYAPNPSNQSNWENYILWASLIQNTHIQKVFIDLRYKTTLKFDLSSSFLIRTCWGCAVLWIKGVHTFIGEWFFCHLKTKITETNSFVMWLQGCLTAQKCVSLW